MLNFKGVYKRYIISYDIYASSPKMIRLTEFWPVLTVFPNSFHPCFSPPSPRKTAFLSALDTGLVVSIRPVGGHPGGVFKGLAAWSCPEIFPYMLHVWNISRNVWLKFTVEMVILLMIPSPQMSNNQQSQPMQYWVITAIGIMIIVYDHLYI